MGTGNAVNVVAARIRSKAAAKTMGSLQRAKWAALGAVLPTLVRLSGQQNVYEAVRSLGISGALDIIFPVLLSIIAAAAVSLIFQDETNIYKLVVMGVSAPALITSWQGYNLAQSAAQAIQTHQQFQNQLAPPGSSVPQNAPVSLNSFSPFSMGVVYAAQSSSISPFPHYDPGSLTRLGSSISGSAPVSRDYFVILSASASADVARQQQAAMAPKFAGKRVELFRTPDGYSPTLYCVVLSPNVTFGDAQNLQKQALPIARSAYIWTFGYAVHPTS